MQRKRSNTLDLKSEKLGMTSQTRQTPHTRQTPQTRAYSEISFEGISSASSGSSAFKSSCFT